jgi:hypothetical protein
MKTQPTSTLSAPRRAARQPGLAIVVVVSLMALLMLLVLAFLLTSSTNRSISSTDVAIRQADSLADLAKETIIADLIGEMKDGSKNTNQNEDGTYSFDIEDPKSMVPFRAVNSGISGTDDFNLIVKQSASGVKFSNGGSALDRASNVSTNTKDLDGRKIAEKRWSAPKLFPPGADLTQNQVPDWIYTTRDGSNPTSFSPENSRSLDSSGEPSPDYVVGRYAYQVYDVSGLLDANVAGNVTASAPANVLSRKGSLVWADLSVLPNSGSNLAGLADWRRISSKNWPKGDSQSGVEDFIREWGGVKGWMKTPLVNNNSDNLFLSRKDLIDYQKANPNVLSEENLRFFTTNFRALNRPSWAPTVDAANGFQYESNKDSANAQNRRIAGVLVKGVFNRRDKSQAVPGEPLVKTRFPLSKLKAFEAPRNLGDIQKYFGLTPVSGTGESTWKYTADYDNGGRSLLPLEKIAAQDREPNFFELLNAGLLEGSLGNTMALDSFFRDVGRDTNPAYQVLRIGACIIDQWDRDDNPTVIQYGDLSPATGVRIDDAIGVENLPYFHMLGELRFRRGRPPADQQASGFVTFQLWNPHDNPVAGSIAAGDFRIATAGTTKFRVFNVRPKTDGGYTDVPPFSTTGYQDTDTRTATMDADFISFSVSDFNTSFSNPTFLRPGVAGARANNQAKDEFSDGGATVIGHEFGRIDLPYDTDHPIAKRYGGAGGIRMEFDPSIEFALQKNINGAWVTYQVLPMYFEARDVILATNFQKFSNFLYSRNGNYSGIHYGLFTDPRTTRYGLSFTVDGAKPETSLNRTTAGDDFTTGYNPPSRWTTPIGRIPEQFASNAPGGATVVVDRDGVRRPADDGSPFTNSEERPTILNRPFQSVAEMGYAFRDAPWTTLNFFGDPSASTNQGDGALLDLFSMSEASTYSGVVNPNTASEDVLKSLLTQAAVREGSSLTVLSEGDAEKLAKAIRQKLDETPLLNTGEIAPLIGEITQQVSISGGFKTHKDRQVIARALSDVSNIRTWNLMIDVVAQSGKLAAGAQDFSSFVTQGEKRMWYQVAIDRITGEIISLQKEAIFE